MNTARSPKKTMASWVADLEQGTAARRPDDGGRFGATARVSPAKSKTHPPRRPPPFHTFPDPAPQPVPPRLSGNKSPGKRPRGAAGDAEDAAVSARAGPTKPASGRSAEPKRTQTLDKNMESIVEDRPFRADVVSRADARLTDARAASSLWDRVETAVESCSVALDDAAAATESDAHPDPAAGTPGFGRTSNAAYGAGSAAAGSRGSNVSNATRKKRVTRAASKIRMARNELRGLRSAFDELRDFATATQAALFRARRTENDLRSTAGYAEETTARLKRTSQAHKQAQMTAKQLGEALDAANAHIADLSAKLRSAEAEASEVSEARAIRERALTALERVEKAESANVRHKEAVAKLTADNMVFLMRLKESETELRDARAEADSMRVELEESRGAWFDKARRDVERVVQNAMRRAESADAALEAEIAQGEKRAKEWAEENARLRAVAAQNESLAETTTRAAAALDEAAEAGRLNDLALRDSRRREFDALNAQKAATAAMAAAREEMGVLKQRMAMMAAALEDQKRVSEGLVEKARTSVAALATQQQINAGVMRLKNDAEWRMLEMRAAFERAGLEAPRIEERHERDEHASDVKTLSTPRLAGRPGPAEKNGGVNHSALSPLPAPNDFGLDTPMPISPETLARATEEAMRLAGVPARAPVAESVAAALEEYRREFAFSPEKKPAEKTSPAPKKSPPRRSPAKPPGSRAEKGELPARARAGMSTTAAPLVANSRHGNVYGAAEAKANPADPADPARNPKRLFRDARDAFAGENRSPSSRAKNEAKHPTSPVSVSPAASPSRAAASPSFRGTATAKGPAWGASPAKGKFREDRAAADAVADARRASAEWSRAQARSYSSKKSRQEAPDAPPSPDPGHADVGSQGSHFHAAYAPLPSEPPGTHVGFAAENQTILSRGENPRSPKEHVSFRASMATAASNARRRVDMDHGSQTVGPVVPVALPVSGEPFAGSRADEFAGGDAVGDAVVPEEVFLRAAERGTSAKHTRAKEVVVDDTAAFEDGWIGGRPAVSSRANAGDAGGMTRVASRASAATVSDSDDDDDARENKKRRAAGSLTAPREDDSRRAGSSEEASDSAPEFFFDFGIAAEHEAAMTRLLGPGPRGQGYGQDYGATRRVSPRRRTEAESRNSRTTNEEEEDAVEIDIDARAGAVSFSNALPRIR